MQTRETFRGLFEEYDRLVVESQARASRSRELGRLVDQLCLEAADLAARMCQLADWCDQGFRAPLAAPAWLN